MLISSHISMGIFDHLCFFSISFSLEMLLDVINNFDCADSSINTDAIPAKATVLIAICLSHEAEDFHESIPGEETENNRSRQ